jgi:beta-lactamase superfamily II metal-dependent hydrolase
MSSIKNRQSVIHFLKAYHGDCLFIQSFDAEGNDFNILIDGGTAATFEFSLLPLLKKIPCVDLIVLTHIDSDHISGLIRLIKHSIFKTLRTKFFWVNGANLIRLGDGEKISYNQGVVLETLLLDLKVESAAIVTVHEGLVMPMPIGIAVEVLSPTRQILDELFKNWPTIPESEQNAPTKISSGAKSQLSKGNLEDLAKLTFAPTTSIKDDIFNSSSISFVLRLPDTSILLLGDARPEIIAESLLSHGYSSDNKLSVDYVKVSHHGSLNNTSCDMLDLIQGEAYLISTNGGNAHHQHPDREVIARIIHHPSRDKSMKRILVFNHRLADIEKKSGQFISKEDLEVGNWEYRENVQELRK